MVISVCVCDKMLRHFGFDQKFSLGFRTYCENILLNCGWFWYEHFP